MNNEIFNVDGGASFPLTKDRMAEMQGDWQSALLMASGLLEGPGWVIVSGCESAGAPGWAVATNEQGQREVMEVKSGNGTPTHLTLTTEEVTAENNEGTTVTVRRKRHLTWTSGGSGTSAPWAQMKRLRARVTAQDDAEAVTLTSGTGRWEAAAEGGYMKAQMTGGRAHLVCNMRAITFQGQQGGVGEAGYLTNEELVLPQKYRPSGDTVVALLYNGQAAAGVLTKNGVLLTGRATTGGDTLVMDTFVDCE